jgi:hypothetical protein
MTAPTHTAGTARSTGARRFVRLTTHSRFAAPPTSAAGDEGRSVQNEKCKMKKSIRRASARRSALFHFEF